MLKSNLHYSLAVLLLVLSGCRVGNYSSSPTSTTTSTFKSTELFYTQPTNLQTVAIYSDGNGGTTNLSNSNVDVSAVPTSVTQTFSNPVYFATPTDTTKPLLFVGWNQSSYLSTALDSAGKVSSSSNSTIATLWNNPNCQTQIQVTQSGTFDRTKPTTVVAADGTKTQIAGRLGLTFTYMRAISGDCAADLQNLANCYTTGSGCSTGELSAAETLFDLYTKQSQVLDPTNSAQVSKIIGLAYIVTFK